MIDTHAHLGKVIFGKDPVTPEEIIIFIDNYGIEKTVILPLVNPEEEHYYYTTEQALEDCEKYPDRFIPFVNVNPRRGSNDGSYDFYPLIKEYVDKGCKGFGEILSNMPTNDKRLKGICKVCESLELPVVLDFRFASSTCGVIEPIGMPYLEEILNEFPRTTFIGHVPSFWAEISAWVAGIRDNYPKGEVKKPGKADYLLEKYPNLYADLSAMSGYNALARDLDYAKKFLEKHYKKLLFTTDRFVNRGEPHIIEHINNIGLSTSIKVGIFMKNAEELLKL